MNKETSDFRFMERFCLPVMFIGEEFDLSTYLNGGYYEQADNGDWVLRSDLLSSYAKQIALELSSMKAAQFASLYNAIKSADKKSVSFKEKKTTFEDVFTDALILWAEEKVPEILIAFLEGLAVALYNDADYHAMVRHMKAVYAYLLTIEKVRKE